MHGDSVLPDWLERGVESSLRDTGDDAPAPPPLTSFTSSAPTTQRPKGPITPVVLTSTSGSSSPNVAAKGQFTDLDKFYEDEDEDDDDEGSEEGDEEASTEEGSVGEEDDSDSEDPHEHR
jgi:AP-3 complex subunit beta